MKKKLDVTSMEQYVAWKCVTQENFDTNSNWKLMQNIFFKLKLDSRQGEQFLSNCFKVAYFTKISFLHQLDKFFISETE